MKYKITHVTTYEYSHAAPLCQNEARLTPRVSRAQNCNYHRLVVRPTPSWSGKRVDYFGNLVNYFAVHEAHRRLSVTAISKVDVRPAPLPESRDTPAWEQLLAQLRRDTSIRGLDARQFCFDSHHAAPTREIAAYAAESFPPRRPLLEAAIELTQRIFDDFAYDPTATTVNTPLAEVFEIKRGVCQDLAHVEIACLRSLGLPARYVSGYLRTVPPEGKPRLVGADASHAWLSVYCGQAGWVDLDPTNNLVVGAEHVTVAWGRDYDDVCPINGMFVGGGAHTMHVSVDVAPTDE